MQAAECLYGQAEGRCVKRFSGGKEIDLVPQRLGILGYISYKALGSMLDIQDCKHRNRLMDAVHGADSLANHFGRAGEWVAVLVAIDFFAKCAAFRGTLH